MLQRTDASSMAFAGVDGMRRVLHDKDRLRPPFWTGSCTPRPCSLEMDRRTCMPLLDAQEGRTSTYASWPQSYHFLSFRAAELFGLLSFWAAGCWAPRLLVSSAYQSIDNSLV
mmetsp:Transcript_16909/g.28139  ORF Transcript_16909/g.28139 Transcript_16909/m.28139 type:complete len:113 (-) Transcript_16909:79-417(-)